MKHYILGDLIDEISERENNPSTSGYERFVGLEHYVSGDLEIKKYGTTENLNSAMKVFKSGDILVARRNVYLKRASVVYFDGLTSGDSIVLRAKDETMARILPFILNTSEFWEYADQYSDGTMSKRLSPKTLKAYEFDLPDDEELPALADLLWSMVDTKTAYEELLTKTDELVKSQFIEMFGDIGTGGYKYLTRKLSEVADVGSSHRVFTSEFVEAGVPFYRGTEIGELANGQQPSDPYYITEEHYQRLASDSSKPKIGDILLPSICNKGQVWMVDNDAPFYYKDGRVLSISANRELLNTRYLQYFMKLKTEVEYPKMGSGSTFAEFKIFMLKDMDVITPPREVQDRFEELWKQSDKSKFELQKSIEKINALIKSVLYQAINE